METLKVLENNGYFNKFQKRTKSAPQVVESTEFLKNKSPGLQGFFRKKFYFLSVPQEKI
jgi:hypothetical protein